MKPFAESSEQNKQPIHAVLQLEFANATSVLEIGSGTGQHAVYFAEKFPHLHWHCSDLAQNLPGIQLWLKESPCANLHGPHELDVMQAQWPAHPFDGVFTANTAHIMHWPMVVQMFAGIGRVLAVGGKSCVYGPFNYQGRYTSDSNARFDQWLKQRDPASGIRDIDDLQKLAHQSGLTLIQDYEMPVNNRLLVWRKETK
jgi:cyclopropane fatty-acyl-phospholipid synthase-like methyltransferase